MKSVIIAGKGRTSDYDLTELEQKLIRENSIERVINTSMRLAEMADDEDTFINVEDWRMLKRLVVKLWERERNSIFIEMQKEKAR